MAELDVVERDDVAGPESIQASTMAAPDVKYGGDFTWVETVYTLKVPAGLSPLQWLNGLTKKFFGFQEVIFDCSGCFRKPGMQQPCFPVGKIDLRWRWDE